jgi:uncharacterized membrane protein YraQ (UPF0718 family)
MSLEPLLDAWAEASVTAVAFFWKAGWAFVLGYAISAVIQAFVPKARLTPLMGGGGPKSVALATGFGAASSSCSFAALATARSLFGKGAHFVAAVAFMFASTNLVIELGILIFLFLGWPYLLAEILGGVVLIGISSLIIRLTWPDRWIRDARERVEAETDETEDFDWKARLTSRDGWRRVGRHFRMEWGMVWEDILIGFTVAGFMAVVVPADFWSALFLTGQAGQLPSWLIALENAIVAPFVAAATFIGSMGNIPLATVLAANGVLFAGIMGFIYSDLMVPPLVRVNAKYYGRKVALFIAAVMFVSIVLTALLLDGAFALFDATPSGTRPVGEVARFGVDYTLWLNLAFVLVGAALVLLGREREPEDGHDHDGGEGGGGIGVKRAVVLLFLAVLAGGLLTALLRSV